MQQRREPISVRPRVFLDTAVLLKAFSATRKQAPLPAFLTDADAERLTFEKCIYEAYLAFRGVGGKKPDEGRGRWAEQNLKLGDDPSPLSHLANRYHGGSTSRAHFWLNFIEEAAADLEGDEQRISEMVSPEGQPAALAELQARRELAVDTGRLWKLCSDFYKMLEAHQVRVLAYLEVFSPSTPDLESANCDPRVLDALFQSVTLPAEDFEIVYAAMRAGADLFVTDDYRLRRCSFSLGLNLPLSPAAFCTGAEYEEKVEAWRRRELFAEFA
jgi:hypothetical protein